MNKRIGLFTRKPILNFHFSIESALKIVLNGLLKRANWQMDWLEMPTFSKGVLPRIKMIFFAWSKNHEINHILGDIYFIALAFPSKSLVITYHDLLFLHRKRGLSRLFLWLFWVLIPVFKARKIIAVSNHTKREIIRFTFCNPNKIIVIPSLISSNYKYSYKAFNQELPCILHIGTAWNKNLDHHIKALHGIPCTFKVVGKLSKCQNNNLVKSGIDFYNIVQASEDEMLEIYHACDILLFASLNEGFGLPILEAQTIGRIVVTSNFGAMAETAGEGAVLVNPYSPISIRAGILSMLNNADLRSVYLDKGFRNRSKYSTEVILDQHEEIYKSF